MSLQATIAKTLLKLPPKWLVRLSGGAPLELGGRRLDPHFQFIAHGAKRQTPMHELSAQEARAAAAAGMAMFAAPPEPGVAVEDFALDAPGRSIPVRLYRPEGHDPAVPTMTWLHQGGGVIGDLDTSHAFCSMLAAASKGAVLSVDYRLAPEHKFPAGLDDSIFAYEWVLRNAERHGGPAGEAAIGGDSMGGHFSAIIAQTMKTDGKPQPALQLLVYPATCMVTQTPSRSTYGETYPLSTATMDFFLEQYLPKGQDLSDIRVSPAQATDLAGLAPAIIATAGFDPLVDEG